MADCWVCICISASFIWPLPADLPSSLSPWKYCSPGSAMPSNLNAFLVKPEAARGAPPADIAFWQSLKWSSTIFRRCSSQMAFPRSMAASRLAAMGYSLTSFSGSSFSAAFQLGSIRTTPHLPKRRWMSSANPTRTTSCPELMSAGTLKKPSWGASRGQKPQQPRSCSSELNPALEGEMEKRSSSLMRRPAL